MQGIDVDKYYTPVAHEYLFQLIFSIVAIHILAVRILDVSNVFHNKNNSIYERVCVSPPPYYRN